MKKLLTYLAGGFIAVAILGSLTEADHEPTSGAARRSQPQPDAASDPGSDSGSRDPEPEPAPEPAPEPEARYQLASCDLGTDELVGSTKVANTGEVAASVHVTFKWQLGNGSWITASPKKLRLPEGREQLVFFSSPADIDTQLSFQDHPGYFDSSNCKTKTTIGRPSPAAEADSTSAPGARSARGTVKAVATLASCDLGTDELVGSARVSNVGDAAGSIVVGFKWQLGNGSWVTATPKTINLKAGSERLVFFAVPATIDTQLSFQDHPGYFDSSNCRTAAES